MTDDDDVAMRNLIIFAVVAMAVAVAIIPAETSDAERPADYPTELVELQYWDGIHATIIYVMPNHAIGSTNIPPLPSGCTYWVRNDTREVVTSQTVFATGTYLITGYSWVPEPWGEDPEPTNTSSAPDNTIPTVAIVLSAVAIITSTAAIVLIMRRK